MHKDWKKIDNPDQLVKALAANCLADDALLADIKDVITRAGELARQDLEQRTVSLNQQLATISGHVAEACVKLIRHHGFTVGSLEAIQAGRWKEHLQ